MVYSNFDQILEDAQKQPLKPRVAVAGAADDHAMEAALIAITSSVFNIQSDDMLNFYSWKRPR